MGLEARQPGDCSVPSAAAAEVEGERLLNALCGLPGSLAIADLERCGLSFAETRVRVPAGDL